MCICTVLGVKINSIFEPGDQNIKVNLSFL